MDISIKLQEYSEKLEKYYNDKYNFLDSYLLKFLNNKNKQEQYEEVKKKIKLLINKIKKSIKNNSNKTENIKFVSIIYNIFNEIYECNIIDDKKSLHTILVLLKLLNKLKEYLLIETESDCSSKSSLKSEEKNKNSDKCDSEICESEYYKNDLKCTSNSKNDEIDLSTDELTSSSNCNNCLIFENCLEDLPIDVKKLLQIVICNFNNILNIIVNMIKLISAYIIYLENKPEEEIIKIFVNDYNYNLKLLVKNIANCDKYENEKIKYYLDKTLVYELLNIDNIFDFLKTNIKIEKQICILREYLKKLRCIENLLENNIEIIKCKNIY